MGCGLFNGRRFCDVEVIRSPHGTNFLGNFLQAERKVPTFAAWVEGEYSPVAQGRWFDLIHDASSVWQTIEAYATGFKFFLFGVVS
jgi:hypothetical protein